MEQERMTPEAEVEPEVDDTPPPEEPVEIVEADSRPDQPAPAAIAQAEYTKATQLNAAIRRELGLTKSATYAEVMDAFSAARQPDQPAEEEDAEAVDPRVYEYANRARDAELRVQRAIYGEEFATDAVELLNAARQTDDIEDLFTLVASFRDKHGRMPTAAATDEATPSTDSGDESGPGVIDTSEGERTPRPVQQSSGGRRESGVVGALRGLLTAAADERGRR